MCAKPRARWASLDHVIAVLVFHDTLKASVTKRAARRGGGQAAADHEGTEGSGTGGPQFLGAEIHEKKTAGRLPSEDVTFEPAVF